MKSSLVPIFNRQISPLKKGDGYIRYDVKAGFAVAPPFVLASVTGSGHLGNVGKHECNPSTGNITSGTTEMANTLRQFLKRVLPEHLRKVLVRWRKVIRAGRGDIFQNPGPISEEDFLQIKNSIDEIAPSVFIEIGTGRGVSTENIFTYLSNNFPECEFYTIDIFLRHVLNARSKFADEPRFHAVHGLSVLAEETTPPAFSELKNHSGPYDVLRTILNRDLHGKYVDIAFIDSRKGTSVAEFNVLEKHMAGKGVIFCYDVLNDGKGVELLNHLRKHGKKYCYDVLDTGPAGLLKIIF